MGFIKVSCPSCGGDVELSGDREFGFCTFCGSKIVRDKILVEHKGNISLDGMASEKSLLERAFLFIESKDFTNAQNYFERVLDINPRCSKAYMGKLMCKLCVADIQDLGHQIIPLESYKDYSFALRFATSEEFQIYQELNKKTLKNFDQEMKNLVRKKNYYQSELFGLIEKQKTYKMLRIVGYILYVIPGLIIDKKLKDLESKILVTKALLNEKEKEIYNLTSKSGK